MVEHVVFFEVLQQFSVCLWCHAVYFNNVDARLFVQYCSSAAMSLIRFIISPQFITPCTNIGRGLWIFVELGFPSMESSFVSFVNKHYRLCVSIFVSGILCCVLCILFLLVRFII